METNVATVDLRDPAKLIDALNLETIEGELDELERRRQALLVLARSARARDKRSQRGSQVRI